MRLVTQILAQHRREQFNAAQRIPDLMRDVTDHLPHGLQPIASLQTVFQLSNVGHVMDQHQFADQTPGFIGQVALREGNGHARRKHQRVLAVVFPDFLQHLCRSTPPEAGLRNPQQTFRGVIAPHHRVLRVRDDHTRIQRFQHRCHMGAHFFCLT